MKVHLPGFPTEVSEPIELPDIGELLMYPAFQAIHADDFMKHATDFQRYLLGKTPLRNDRKYVLIRSGVWLLEPNTRSHVSNAGTWHIDGIADDSHTRPDERVFILSSPCSAVTEFNLNPLEIDSDPAETRKNFANRIAREPDKYGVIPRKIEACRIYTFENHLHRAVDPQRVEFRYFLRVRETDEGASTVKPIKELHIHNVGEANRVNIEYHANKLSIYYPQCLQGRSL
jgi:hypothetical protein